MYPFPSAVGARFLSLLRWLLVPDLVLQILGRHIFAVAFLYFLVYSIKWLSRPFLQLVDASVAQIQHAMGDSHLQRRQELERAMVEASTYAEWDSSAQQLDVLDGKHEWKISADSTLYDAKRIRHNLTWLRALVDHQDVKGIINRQMIERSRKTDVVMWQG